MSITLLTKPSQKEISQRKLETYDKYSKVIQWGRAYPVEFTSRFMGIELLDMQKYAFYNSWSRDFVLWLESRNAGKALALDTPIPTPKGYITMGDLKIGDNVFDENGNPTKVIYISEIFYNHKCYEIEFEDGEKIIADSDHLWDVQTKNYRNRMAYTPTSTRKRANFDTLDKYGFKTLKTSDLIVDYVRPRKDGKGNEYKYRVPKASPLNFPTKDLLIDPYVLGVWLGDGGSNEVRITCDESDLDNMCKNLNQCGHKTKIYNNKDRCSSVGLDIDRHQNRNPFMSSLKELNLVGNKHIPEIYLQSSIEQRLSLLQGLMDTDGSCDSQGRCEFSQKSFKFVMQFSNLLNSLSIKHHIGEKNIVCNGKQCTAYRVYFCTDKTLPCFRLDRKYQKLKDKLADRSQNKSIVSIKEVHSVPTKCIQVDNPRKLYLCGTKNTVTHNTTKLSVYTMTRSLLFPFHVTYFLGNTGDQAKEVYKKVEKIAKKEIESFSGCTDIFFSELKKNGVNSDGFVHNPASFTCTLFNGAEINTLNSDITNIKGKRANLVCFDEAGWFSDELFVQAENFVNQDENFKLGGNVDITLEPKGLPRQLLYASSASDTSSEYYKKFRYFSERMLIGDQKYFVCNFNIDMVMKAKYNGEPYPALISQDKVDKAMGDNRDKALRELYNKFSADSHEGQILTRREIMQYTKLRPPLLSNDTGNRLFALAWDSARLNDNSVIGAAEFYDDPERGWCMDICNLVSLVDISTKKKTPMILPDQVKRFQDLLLDYNGSDKKNLDYENIKAVICDSGAGGQMVGGVSDYMLDDWVGKDGKSHKGIIDKNHKANETSSKRFKNAVDIMKLVDPKAHRNDIFDAAEKMTKLGVITFPADYDGKDYILSIDDDGNENKYDLNAEEKDSLVQIDLMKTEIITMCKYTSAGNVRYDFPPDKRTMHDDRAFVYGLLCWYLAQLRKGQLISRPINNDNFDPSKFILSKQPQLRKI